MSAPEIPRVAAADLPGVERARSEQSHCLITSVPPCERGCPYRQECSDECRPFAQWADTGRTTPPPKVGEPAEISEILREAKILGITQRRLEIAAGFPAKFLSRKRKFTQDSVEKFHAALELLKFNQ